MFKIFLTIIILLTTNLSFAELYLIETNQKGMLDKEDVMIICISDMVFVKSSSFESSLVQVLKEDGLPMTCEEYKKRK